MKTLNISPSLTQQVYQAIFEEVLEGRLTQGEHLVQEQLASRLGVSRQPIQQAMALLKADGVVEEVGRRGLRVAALKIDTIRDHYAIRKLLDGYAARAAAHAVASGKLSVGDYQDEVEDLFAKGAEAVRAQNVRDQIRHDEALHKLIYRMSGNPVLEEMSEPNWRYLRRVMAQVLSLAEPAVMIWEQHRQIVDAVMAGDEDAAASHAEAHVSNAADRLMAALTRHGLAEPTRSSAA